MTTKTLMTATQFEGIAAQLGPCELVRGEVVQLSPAGLDHAQICGNAYFLISQWARQTKRGRTFAGEAGLIIASDPDTVRRADVAYYSDNRLPRSVQPSGFCDVPPELVVEVVGKGQGWGAMVAKAGEYLAMGVDRVWIIDPKTKRVHIFRPDAEPTPLSDGETLTDDAILPGFSCPVSDFFAN